MKSELILRDLEDIKKKIESIIETLEIMSDEELVESIRRGREEARKGKLRDFNELIQELDISP